jgi:hypothetical protein
MPEDPLTNLPYPTFLPDLCRELEACEQLAPLTPSELMRYFLLLLRGHWACPESFGPKLSRTLAPLAWNPDPLTRDINIELAGAQDIGTKNHMIWLTLGNFRFRKLTLGNRGRFEENNAEESYVVGCTCQLLVRHEAPTLMVASDMAWTSFSFLLGFQEGILAAVGGDGAAFDPELLADPQQTAKTSLESFRVDVGCKLSLNVAVATTVESHILKRVTADLYPSLP